MSLFNILRQNLNSPQYSEILTGASRSLITKISGLLTAYLFAFVVSRVFGAHAWGSYSLALSIILFGAILGTAGLDIAMLKITASLNEDEEVSSYYLTTFSIISIISFCCSVLIFFLSGWFAEAFFGNTDLTITFKIAALGVIPYCILNLNARILQGQKKINKYVFIRFVSHHFVALFLLVLLLLFWNQNQIIIISYVVGLYLITGLSFFWLRNENIRLLKVTLGKEKTGIYSRLLKLSLPLLFANSLIFVNGWIDTIMVGFFMTEQDVGIYNIALKVSGLLLFVLTSINAVVAPNFSNLFSQNKIEELQQLIRYSTSLIFYTTIPLFLILILFPEFILSIFGEEFKQGKVALTILCIGSFMNAIVGSVGYFLQMTDSQVAFQNITLISFVLGFVLNLLLIPAYGIEGAAWATCISMIFWNCTGALFIKIKYNIIVFYTPFGKWNRD